MIKPKKTGKAKKLQKVMNYDSVLLLRHCLTFSLPIIFFSIYFILSCGFDTAEEIFDLGKTKTASIKL